MNRNITSRRLDVRRLLDGYTVGPGEDRFFREMDVLASSPSDVLSSYCYAPGHFTASAFVVDPARTMLLLIHHRKLGRWLQPGGHIEPTDASMAEAAEREAVEETGISAIRPVVAGLFDIDVHRIPAHGDAPPHAHHDLRFLFETEDTAIRPSAEVTAATWVPVGELASYPTDRSVIRAVRKIPTA